MNARGGNLEEAPGEDGFARPAYTTTSKTVCSPTPNTRL